MHKYLPVVPLLGIVTTITIQSQTVLALEPAEVSAKAKEFTVQIDGEETGTGTIIERNGNSYSVITCWHVMDTPGEYQVMTPDGETYQVTEIKNLRDIDIAVIKFTSSKTYSVAELGNSETVISGTTTYVVGYPDPFPGLPERSYLFSSAEVQSRLSKGEKGYQMIHNGSFTPGSSGGGIFDSGARLIGVNGQFISEGNTGKAYGKGIPLEIYLATRPDLSIPTNIPLPQDFVSVGIKKFKQEDYQGAITEFNKALETNTNNLEAYYSRGITFFILKDYEAAIADFNRFLQLSPNNYLAYFYRGYIRAEKGDYQGAITDYNQTIQLNANFDLAYTNRGFAYSKLGNTQNAITDYNRAIKINPESVNAYYNRGLVFGRDLGDYQKALSDFNKSIELAPKDAQVYVDRGNVYILLGDIQLAIDDYGQAISLSPQHAEAHYNRGIAYSQQNEPEKALEDLQRASTLFQAQEDSANYQRALDRIREIQKI